KIVIKQVAPDGPANQQPLTASATIGFPIRTGSSPHGMTKLETFKAGEKLKIEQMKDILQGSARMKIDIAARPRIQLKPVIEKLIRYPYGCVEQTTSSMYPMLYAADIVADGDDETERAKAITNMIHAGINRLWSMQTRDGGLAYWPRGTSSTLWGSTYAAGFLLEAKTAGYKIDSNFMNSLMDYLEEHLKDDSYPTWSNEKITPNSRAMLCRVLATFGRIRHGWMAKLAENTGDLDMAGRAHLAGAYVAAGKKDRAWKIISENTISLVASRTTRGRLTSQIRQDAVLLSVLLDMDQNHAWTNPLARRLQQARKQGVWGSTINNASALVALSRFQVLNSEDADFKGRVIVAGKTVAEFSSDKDATCKIDNVNGPVTIESDGSGKVYATIVTEGRAAPGVIQPHDNGLVIERKWKDSVNEIIDPKKLKVGDLVHVEVTVLAPGGDVHNIAIVDALCGGMEVENPRLASSGDSNIDYRQDNQEFLDDRVVIFTTASRKKRTFTYSLRVTTAGTYNAPAIQGSCMYDPAIASLG
ncbi:MAG TPA: hypothetical protein ENL03_05545, partial [Phycisphaerae bacterium]|nr:hypothetical protein [Phycisphaerae bacterium]